MKKAERNVQGNEMPSLSASNAYPALMSRRVAAPSWVIPGTVHDNALFLTGKVHEIGICMFEAKSCLAYDATDLPASLADMDIGWHVHLPGDLPWSDGADAVAQISLALMEKVAFLGARRAVLHPPVDVPVHLSDRGALLAGFVAAWERSGRLAGDILLENIRGEDLTNLWDTVLRVGCKVCLDVGHLLSYGQYGMLSLSGLGERIGMLHACAPGIGGRHLPLDALDAHGSAVAASICAFLPQDATIMVEVFDWAGVEASLPVLEAWFAASSAVETDSRSRG